MATRHRILIDLNIILDVLQQREPFYPLSARVLASAETGLTELIVKLGEDPSRDGLKKTPERVAELLQFLRVAPVNQETIEQALTLPYGDFEDAVQMVSAVQVGAKYLVTRDARDYKAGPLPDLLPAEMLALLSELE